MRSFGKPCLVRTSKHFFIFNLVAQSWTLFSCIGESVRSWIIMIVQILPVSCSFSCDNVTCVFCKVRNCELLKRFRVSTRLLYVYMSSTGGATSLPDPDRYDGVLQIQEHCLDSLQPLRFTWETLRTVRGLASWSTPTTKSEKQTRRTFCSLNVWNLYYIYRYITYLQGWDDKKEMFFEYF